MANDYKKVDDKKDSKEIIEDIKSESFISKEKLGGFDNKTPTKDVISYSSQINLKGDNEIIEERNRRKAWIEETTRNKAQNLNPFLKVDNGVVVTIK